MMHISASSLFCSGVWVAYKERTLGSRLLWLLLILALGNIAMSFYVLIQLFRLKPDQGVEALLQR